MEVLKVLNNRYQLLSILKSGGFGTIYKGYDTILGKNIAVKEINPNFLKEAFYIDLFLREAKQAAKMNHQNIVHIYDLVETAKQQFYIVMELIDGLDLSRILAECKRRGQTFPEHLAVYTIAEVCKALDYAHNCHTSESDDASNLVHQDISPSNIMVSKNGIVKLIDFGLAGIQKLSTAGKPKFTLQGKINYMSPEQAAGDAPLDKKSDLFSLGLVLYEALKGKRFFQSQDNQQIIEALRNGKLKMKDLSSLPKALQRILQKALEKEREQRYQNANQFYIDLMTYLITTKDISDIDAELADFMVKLMTARNRARPRPDKMKKPAAAKLTTLADLPENFSQAQQPGKPGPTPRLNLSESKISADEEIRIIRPLKPKTNNNNTGVPAGKSEKAGAEIDFHSQELKLDSEDNGSFKQEIVIGEPETESDDLLADAGDLLIRFDGQAPESDDETLLQNSTAPSAQESPPPTFEDEVTEYFDVEDEIKTVIDVDRLITRERNPLLARTPVVLAALLLTFFALDFAFHWTKVGTAVYDYVFPPAIRIHSVPAGAKVFLNNKPLPGVTPLSVDKISPGVYELKLTVAGFAPIVKSIQVFSKGDVAVKGNEHRRGNQPYLFKFKTTLQLDSEPSGAEVYLNDIKYGKTTPCAVTWEVGEPCQIEMKKSGFANLTGYTLNTEHSLDDAEDRRLWKLDILKEPYTSFKVTGYFGKLIAIDSNPSKAALYLDDNPKPVGLTGMDGKIFFTAAKHRITLKKRGYNATVLKLAVDETTPLEIFATLTRPVQFYAYDASRPKGKDIGAKVVQLIRKNRTFQRKDRTPCRLNLQPYAYTAIISKEGFKDAKVQIAPGDKVVIAKLEPMTGEVAIAVLDEKTGEPISDVKIKIRSLDSPNSKESLFSVSDEEGTSSGKLSPGLYLFSTEKSGYQYQEKSLMVQSANLNLIEFSLSKP
ncbi:MAG: protein kinase [bacterium]